MDALPVSPSALALATARVPPESHSAPPSFAGAPVANDAVDPPVVVVVIFGTSRFARLPWNDTVSRPVVDGTTETLPVSSGMVLSDADRSLAVKPPSRP